MANTSRKGNNAERAVQKDLEAEGWCVGSRRHIGGAGDLLAVHPTRGLRLIEVKATKTPFSGFPPADREALDQEATRICAEPFLAWRKGSKTELIEQAEWPN